jgi:hypothetical protein
MSCELWSLTSRNLMHSFESRDEAVLTVRLYLEAGGLTAKDLASVVYDANGIPSGSVTGPDLVSLVLE